MKNTIFIEVHIFILNGSKNAGMIFKIMKWVIFNNFKSNSAQFWQLDFHYYRISMVSHSRTRSLEWDSERPKKNGAKQLRIKVILNRFAPEIFSLNLCCKDANLIRTR